jgi:hypothetical protein
MELPILLWLWKSVEKSRWGTIGGGLTGRKLPRCFKLPSRQRAATGWASQHLKQVQFKKRRGGGF